MKIMIPWLCVFSRVVRKYHCLFWFSDCLSHVTNTKIHLNFIRNVEVAGRVFFSLPELFRKSLLTG